MTTEPATERRLDQIPKAYDPQETERRLYAWWESSGFFKPRESRTGKRFVISMPPPNVTGALHLGHALTATLEDIMIRYHRMRGDETLWVPGEDHAGIATQTVVEREIAKEGLDRQQMGREAFVERVWQWVRAYKSRIQNQHRRLGVSTDWERERFTLDEGLARAVREVFVRLYEEGLAYRGERIINWCPRCMSSISDLEVEVVNTPGKLYYMRYPLELAEGETEPRYITVATTRPETILGDTGVAVNPDDDRYRDFVGRYVILPIMGRRIPIVADAAVDKNFGTGAVKMTPAHDPTDFEIGNRHGLERIQVIGFDGKMTDQAGTFAGQDRFEAREGVVAEFARLGLLAKTEDYEIPLGHCSRCHTIIEPLISTQWFVKMTPLATPALGALKYGQMRIVPERFGKTYTDWLENIRDWNISRQLWWGHRIPAWYCDTCGQMTVAREDPAVCAHCGSAEIHQDPDVLDTWFSSWLWPFSTLGWPDDTPDLRRFYPTTVMETGYDIIFFWVARMAMSGIHFLGVVPFETVYLHGLIRDEQGRKMSKSLGNVIDPLEVMDQYGTDALRFTLATSSTPGNDTKLSMNRIAGNRNFANKIWNAARFVIGQTEGIGGGIPALEAVQPKSLADRWIVSRAQGLTVEVTRLLSEFQFGEAGRQIFEFFWSEYCDWYLEIAKGQLRDAAQRERTAGILRATLDRALRLLHPFMPFVTEEVWQHLYADTPEGERSESQRPSRSEEGERPAQALMLAAWPEPGTAADRQRETAAEEEFALLQEIITRIRDARKQAEVEPSRRVRVILIAGAKAAALRKQSALIEQLARTEPPKVERTLASKPEQAMALVAGGVEIYLPLAGLLDVEKELARLAAEMEQARGVIERSRKMLDNPNFVARARPDVVQKEREALAAAEDTLAKLSARREQLAGG
ncbi:MAG: Valyl-tRNA synthetase [Ktedonobacterales bacterium]|jgi:valyl-tRNA synthetase|nr:MAG: Valyl-tRNA synthetase [Ktedonobacterales bacterium]